MSKHIKINGVDVIFHTSMTKDGKEIGFKIKGLKSKITKEDIDIKNNGMSISYDKNVTKLKVMLEDIEIYLNKLNISFRDIRNKIKFVSINKFDFNIVNYNLNSFDNMVIFELIDIE